MGIGFRFWKGTWVIIIVWTFFFIMDIISTFSVGDLIIYMEANPLYKISGISGIVFMNVVAVWLLSKNYDSKYSFNRFLALSTLVWVSVVRIAVIINNFSLGSKVASGEITKELVENQDVAVMQSNYALLMIFVMILPIAINILTYWIFLIVHKVERKLFLKQEKILRVQ